MDWRLGGEVGNRGRCRRKGNRVRRARISRGGGRSAKMRGEGRDGMDLMAGGTGAEAGEVEAIRLTSGVDKLSTMMAGTDVSNPLLGRGEAVVTHPVSGRAAERAPPQT